MTQETKDKAPGLIFKAMVAIMKDIKAIGKDGKNKQQGYSFRGIDGVYNELHDTLAKHKVFMIPECISERSEERHAKSGSVLIYRILMMKYKFYTEDGSFITAGPIPGEGMDSGDKASNKAMSVAHKYCLVKTFLIPTDDMAEPDGESHVIVKGKNEGSPNSSDKLHNKTEVKEVSEENPQITAIRRKIKEGLDRLEWDRNEKIDFLKGTIDFGDDEKKWQRKLFQVQDLVTVKEGG